MTRGEFVGLLVMFLTAPKQVVKPCRPDDRLDGRLKYEEYRKAFAAVQCTVCARYGFAVVIPGGCEEDFESVKIRNDGRMDYAHRPSCVALGTRFKHLQYHKDYKR